jgi:hypothetical protein
MAAAPPDRSKSSTSSSAGTGRRQALRGEPSEAKRVLAQALERTLALRAIVGAALYIDLLADIAAAEGDDRLAARLSAAAEAAVEAFGAVLPAMAGNRIARLSGVRKRLGDRVFEAELGEGRKPPIESAGAEALAWARR